MAPKPVQAGQDYESHVRRVHAIVLAWQRGEISVSVKRAQIAEENGQFYHGPMRGETGVDLTEPPHVTDQVVSSLADGARIPVEAAEAALSAWRQSGWDAQHADDLAASRRIIAEGRRAYEDILRAAR